MSGSVGPAAPQRSSRGSVWTAVAWIGLAVRAAAVAFTAISLVTVLVGGLYLFVAQAFAGEMVGGGGVLLGSIGALRARNSVGWPGAGRRTTLGTPSQFVGDDGFNNMARPERGGHDRSS